MDYNVRGGGVAVGVGGCGGTLVAPTARLHDLQTSKSIIFIDYEAQGQYFK